MLFDLALFRVLPQALKPLVYQKERWLFSRFFINHSGENLVQHTTDIVPPDFYGIPEEGVKKSRDIRFFYRAAANSCATNEKPVFHFFHRLGLHQPLEFTENLECSNLAPDKTNHIRQGTGLIKLVHTYIHTLKNLGIYDQTMIIIVGDHGTGLADMSVNPTEFGQALSQIPPYKGDFKNFKAAGLPLVLIKRFNSHGDLQSNLSPVSLADIPQTVISEIGITNLNLPGTNIFVLNPQTVRDRRYLAFVGGQEKAVYVAALKEYLVNGNSWDDRSWKVSGRVFYPHGETPKEDEDH